MLLVISLNLLLNNSTIEVWMNHKFRCSLSTTIFFSCHYNINRTCLSSNSNKIASSRRNTLAKSIKHGLSYFHFHHLSWFFGMSFCINEIYYFKKWRGISLYILGYPKFYSFHYSLSKQYGMNLFICHSLDKYGHKHNSSISWRILEYWITYR